MSKIKYYIYKITVFFLMKNLTNRYFDKLIIEKKTDL